MRYVRGLSEAYIDRDSCICKRFVKGLYRQRLLDKAESETLQDNVTRRRNNGIILS